MSQPDPDIYSTVYYPATSRMVRRQQWRAALQPIPQIFDWYKDNVAAGTLLVGAFLIVKGYVLAKGDISTALGILQYEGLASVVVAGLLSSLPILAAAMLALAILRVTRAWLEWAGPRMRALLAPLVTTRALSHRITNASASAGTAVDQGPAGPVTADGQSPPPRRPGGRVQDDHTAAIALAVTTLAAFVLAAVFTPWPYMAAAIGIGLLAGLFRGLVQSRRRDRREGRRRGRRARFLRGAAVWAYRAVISVVVVYAVMAMLATVWVPHEVVVFYRRPAQGQPAHPDVGYVLADDPDGWITILNSGTHGIVRYRDSLVRSLRVCERLPYGGWSDIVDARTPWEIVTRPSFLKFFAFDLHPAANVRCPPGLG